MPFMGSLLVLEGPDGVGKTTLAQRLHDHLRSLDVDCLRVAFPGSEAGSVGLLVHRLHHNPAQFDLGETVQAALQLLHVAAHVDALERRILPALREGRVVILDRSWWSTVVYGREFGLDAEAVQALVHCEKHFWQGAVPTATFLLTRMAAEDEHGNYHALADRYHELARSEEDQHHVYIVGNDANIEQTLQRIIDIIADLRPVIIPTPKQQQDDQLSLWEDAAAAAVAHPEVAHAAEARLPSHAGPEIVVPRIPLETPVLKTYWRFAAARQDIFFKRFRGEAPPWTADPILLAHKFTNAYRACDRVSQYLIRHVIREGNPAPADCSPQDTFFRVMLFKLFNRIDTWRHLESKVGPIRWGDYSFERYDAVLTRAMAEGRQIYSAAYIMPSARIFGHPRKHSNHLRLLELMMKEELPMRLREAKTMAEVFSTIRAYHSMGDFLAYQYATDLNYSDLLNFEEDTFVVAGPGARDGIRKCFRNTAGLSDADVIKMMADTQEKQFTELEIPFQKLWDRSLQLIDCQNLFCEVDKYARVAHPTVTGVSGRTRIKQKFSASPEPICYMFPEKWGLDEKVATAARPAVLGVGQLPLFS